MNAVRKVRPFLLSLVGLLAVLLGAMEHESLLFQPGKEVDAGWAGDRIVSASEAKHDSARFEAYPHESGTEGTFRSENHSLGIPPAMRTSQVQRRHEQPLWRGTRAADLPSPRPGRARADGVLVLRL